MNSAPLRQVLEVGAFDVSDVRAGDETAFADGILTINIGELEELLSADPDLASVSVEIIRPGESVRVINAIDAVEPRIKVDPPGADFSGLLTAPRLVGYGNHPRPERGGGRGDRPSGTGRAALLAGGRLRHGRIHSRILAPLGTDQRGGLL